jgi:hypothetical protein
MMQVELFCTYCTSAQKEAAWNKIRSDYGGKRVRWESSVQDVEADGTVFVSGFGYRGIGLKGIPANQATRLKMFQKIVFEGTLVPPVENTSHGWTMVDVVLVPPTPTPAPTPRPTATPKPMPTRPPVVEATKPPPAKIEGYNVTIEVVDHFYVEHNNTTTAAFWAVNNGSEIVEVYLESTAVIEAHDGVSQFEHPVDFEPWEYEEAKSVGIIDLLSNIRRIYPNEMLELMSDDQLEQYFPVFVQRYSPGIIIQICVYAYTVTGGEKGDAIVAEFRLDNTLDCDGEPLPGHPEKDFNVSVTARPSDPAVGDLVGAFLHVRNHGNEAVRVFVFSSAVVQDVSTGELHRVWSFLTHEQVTQEWVLPGRYLWFEHIYYFGIEIEYATSIIIVQICAYADSMLIRPGDPIVEAYRMDETLDCEGKPE